MFLNTKNVLKIWESGTSYQNIWAISQLYQQFTFKLVFLDLTLLHI